MRKIIPSRAAIKHSFVSFYWFAVGFLLAGAILASIVLFYFQYSYKDRIIPGVFVNNIYIGEKTKDEVEKIFEDKNQMIGQNVFIFKADDQTATISAKTFGMGYDTTLIIDQAFNLGKTKNLPSDIYLILTSYINGTFLNAPYTFDKQVLEKTLEPIQKNIHKEPQDTQGLFVKKFL